MKIVNLVVVVTVILITSAIAQSDGVEVTAPEYVAGDMWKIKLVQARTRSDSNRLSSGIYDVVFSGGVFTWKNEKGENIAEGLRLEAPMFYGDYEVPQPGKKPFKLPFLTFPLSNDSPKEFKYFEPEAGQRGLPLNGSVTIIGIIPITISDKEYQGHAHVMERWGGMFKNSATYSYVTECKCNAKYEITNSVGLKSTAEVISFSVK